MIVGITELDQLAYNGCQMEGCTHEKGQNNAHRVYLHSMCHVDWPFVVVSYLEGSGILLIQCANPECRQEVTRIQLGKV